MTKKILAAAGLAAMCAALCGCAEKKPVLHVYTWSDYIKPELVQQFDRENHCQVVIDTYDSNESMYAKLKAGATGYDLLKSWRLFSPDDFLLLAVGFAVSFVSAWIAVKGFIALLGRLTLRPFAWYRLALAPIVLWIFW